MINIDGDYYARYPIKTEVILKGDDLKSIMMQYVKPYIKKEDIVFISEKMVAATQGRAYRIADIKPSFLARLLSKFVHKSPYGIGLGSPWTMELALREVGVLKILWASFLAAVTKPFGIKGVFYKIAGKDIAAIDGPCSYTLPPYNEYAVLAPLNPSKVAKELSMILGVAVFIVDANDLGVDVNGSSEPRVKDEFMRKVLRDNPLGQSSQQTPIGIIRKCRIATKAKYTKKYRLYAPKAQKSSLIP